jgi:hypothetical protein
MLSDWERFSIYCRMLKTLSIFNVRKLSLTLGVVVLTMGTEYYNKQNIFRIISRIGLRVSTRSP